MIDRQWQDEEERGALLAQAHGARLQAEAQAAQAVRLHAVAASLSRARTPREVAEAILEQGLAALGAEQGAVVAHAGDGETLETLGTAGYPADLTAPYFRFPLAAAVPLAETVRTGAVIIVASPDEAAARYPALPTPDGIQTWIAFPLTVAGNAVGGVGLSHATSRILTDDDLAIIGTLSQQCGQALERARLYEAEQRARVTLLAERDRLKQVLAALPVGVMLTDVQGQVVTLNEAGRAMIGLDTTGERMPRSGEEAYLQVAVRHPDGTPYPAEKQPLARSLLSGERVNDDQEILRHAITGQDIPLLVSSAPLRDPTGTITGAVAVFQDISVLKVLEQAREEFLGAAAHDLKTPITAIQAVAQLARRRLARLGLPEVQQVSDQLATIEVATRRMGALINDLIDVTRLQMGTALELHRRTADLVAVTRSALAQQEGLTAHRLCLEARIPELMAEFDSERLERVIANLIANAIKYRSGDSEIAVRVSAEEVQGASWATCSVRDSGIGIPAADLPRVFDRFYRASNVPVWVPGTGIGLAHARQIVEQHGGNIEVVSQEGSGSTFTVRLPMGAGGADASR